MWQESSHPRSGDGRHEHRCPKGRTHISHGYPCKTGEGIVPRGASGTAHVMYVPVAVNELFNNGLTPRTSNV